MRVKRLSMPIMAAVAAMCLFADEKPARKTEAEAKQKVEESTTQTADLPAGGVLRLSHSTGDLTIEAWDKPDVEITTIKTTKDELSENERAGASAELKKVTVSIKRQGNDLVITTNFPRHPGFPPGWPWSRDRKFDLEYHISVPRHTKLAINHDVGDVNVDGVTGDIEARVLQGQITLHLPEDLPYNIDAKSDYGNVNSDFPGERHRAWIGQSAFHPAPKPAQALKLRVGYGDIVLLRIRIPKTPPPAPTASSGDGL